LYASRNFYHGSLKKIVNVLLIIGVAGFLATGFRFVADIITVYFKWGEVYFSFFLRFLVFLSPFIY